MRWALENKRRLIPAFGYEKRRPAGERIKAGTKLAYIQRVRGGEKRHCGTVGGHSQSACMSAGERIGTHTVWHARRLVNVSVYA